MIRISRTIVKCKIVNAIKNSMRLKHQVILKSIDPMMELAFMDYTCENRPDFEVAFHESLEEILNSLNDAQKQVAALSHDKTDNEIAKHLKVSTRTVRRIRQETFEIAFRYLGIRERTKNKEQRTRMRAGAFCLF
jgi:DNA-directed RNA polymerase specialized sigma24 family protein